VSDSDDLKLTSSDRLALASFGAVYLGYIVAWLFAVRANELIGIDDRFQQAMINFGDFFAIVAPALLFFTVLSQIQSMRWRIVCLAVGLVVLFPFPLFFGVPAL
jgi:hypothetical protein